MKIYNNFSLEKYNTLQVNVLAKHFVEVDKIETLISLINNETFKNNKYTILGKGSNILFTQDYDGIIIKNKIISNLIINDFDDKIEIVAASGICFDDMIKQLLDYQKQNNTCIFGLENLAQIPGEVGSAVVQNIGAYGVEQQDFFSYCKTINIETGETFIFNKDECKFGYRTSIFKHKDNTHFISEVCYILYKANKYNISYPDVHKIIHSKTKKCQITPQLIYDIVTEIRKNKLPDINEYPNAGSFFKNPVISHEQFLALKETYPNINAYNVGNDMKIPAAWLIENAGIKGRNTEKVSVYHKHALIVVNYGQATGQEVVEFANLIIDKVYNVFKVKLEPEIVYI